MKRFAGISPILNWSDVSSVVAVVGSVVAVVDSVVAVGVGVPPQAISDTLSATMRNTSTIRFISDPP